MKEAVKKANERLTATYEEQKDLREFIRISQKICEHEWVFDYTCGHKGEDYDKCDICGATR